MSLRFFIDGIAFWAPTLPGWDTARAAFAGVGPLADPPARRPAPAVLPAAERRRAPDSVAIALEAASAAVESAGAVAAELPSLFVSAHGDLAVNDYMCTTLVDQPTMLSPTKFHNSVHNAAAGYWTIGTGCMESSSALTACEHSFAAGLLEAATLCAAEVRPVLLVGYDIAACGALASVVKSEGLLAVALVLAPVRGARSRFAAEATLAAGRATAPPLRSAAARSLAGNAMADALPLFEAFALRDTKSLALPLASRLSLSLRIEEI